MNIFYIGDFVSENGPSSVDVNLSSIIGRIDNISIYKKQSNKKITRKDCQEFYYSDICHLSGISRKGLFFMLLAFLLRKKRSYTIHGLLREEKKYRKIPTIRLLMEYLIFFLSDNILLVSPSLKKHLNRYELTKSTVCPNGAISKLPEFYGGKNVRNRNKFVSIGGGRPEKGILEVCEQLDILVSQGYNIEFHIFGEDGRDTEDIKKYHFVKYYGFVGKEQLSKCLDDTYIYIQNSRYESFCLAICESIIKGCLIVCSDAIGVNSFIEESDCYIVTRRPEDINSAIIRQLDLEPEFILQTKINSHVLNWSESAGNYLKIWSSK